MSDADGLPPRERFAAMLVLCVGIAVAVLDGAIANVALPRIAEDVHATPAASIWVVNAYQLAITITLLPFASLAERIGYKKVYLGGLAVFTVASGLCGFATTLTGLAAARVIQGFGAAGLLGVNTALVRHVTPRARLGAGMSVITTTVALSAAAGPTVAAGILSVADWPALFLVNVPFGIVALALGWRALPQTPRGKYPFDIVSGILNALTFGLLVSVVDGLGQGENRRSLVIQTAAFVISATIFVRRQLSRPAPMLPLDLLRIPLFGLSSATSILSYAGQMLAFVALPFLFHYGNGASQVTTGLMMTAWPLTVMVIAPIAGVLSDRYPVGILGGAGLAVMTAGLALMAWLPAGATLIDISWRMALCGLGFGFFQTPNNRALIGSAPRNRTGVAGGMLSMSRLLGQTVGTAMVALIFSVTAAAGVAHGASVAVGAGAVCTAVACGIGMLRLRVMPAE